MKKALLLAMVVMCCAVISCKPQPEEAAAPAPTEGDSPLFLHTPTESGHGLPEKGTVPHAAPRFKFAVISDLTGGQAEGNTILREAVAEINLLDVDFTINVGDLIQGYSDRAQETAEWEEVDAELAKLKRPFRRVFGNHDAKTAESAALVRERYGAPYYSFDHKGCHFIVLFTESKNAAGETLSLTSDQAQMDWLKTDLAASKHAVHTFVFFHQPNFRQDLLSLFAGRPTTIYAGHWHKYQQSVESGINYHVLGSTGAGISGDFYDGSFYHTMLVSVDGPEVTSAVVRVGAILPDTLLSVDLKRKVRLARAKLAQLTLTADGPNRWQASVTAPNPLPTPVRVALTWELPEGSPWKAEPAETALVVSAEGESTAEFALSLPDGADAEALKSPPTLKVFALGGRALTAPRPDVKGLDVLYDITVTPGFGE